MRRRATSWRTSAAKWSLMMLEGTLPLRKPGRRPCLGRARELGEADDGGKRRSLEELDQEPHGGRKSDAKRLGQDDEPELREVPEAQRVGRFPLFAGHGLDASAPDLAEERARVQDEP